MPTTLQIARQNAQTYDFYRDGFVVSDGPLVDAETVASLREHCEAVLNGHYETGRAPRSNTGGPDVAKHPPYIEASFPQYSDRTISRFLTYPALGEWVGRVTQFSRAQVIMAMTMKKYPGKDRESRVGWHQDRRYLDTYARSGAFVNLWIALDEVSLDTGPVRFVRRSHLWNLAYSSGFFDRELDESSFKVPEGEKWEAVDAALPAGWATLHGPGTLHGSGRCVGARPRLSILFTIGLSSPGHEVALDPEHDWAKRMADRVVCPVIYEAPESEIRPIPQEAYLFDVHPKVITHA